ncbi:methyltransferase domain-containing protein [Erwinia typographi]|uniref:methyltransferase domain-containing protein n=1 Tax=Erwinia typographi TaxID=371042 RepID=UPI00068B29A9|nr:methyltransferase domain-containing protein [Erwinia typographi]
MLNVIVNDFKLVAKNKMFLQSSKGRSAAPKKIIFDLLDSEGGKILDIGFGVGDLGRLIKNNASIINWEIDGIDGFEPNCYNGELISKKIYRNIWHGLAHEIPINKLKEYDIICLLDVIEHISAENAKELIRFLLLNMHENAFLFISTPLYFYIQNTQQDGDLEEHLIGLPATSMMGLVPVMYAIVPPLIGGFVYKKNSIDFIDLFCPITDKTFTKEKGLMVVKSLSMDFSMDGRTIKMDVATY